MKESVLSLKEKAT